MAVGEASPCDTVPSKKGFISKIIGYFNESNKPRTDKAFDFSIIGGPHYSSDTKFGVGLVAAGLYKTDRSDTILPQSDVSVYFDATTSMFFKLGIEGNHIFPKDRARIYYDVYFSSVNSKFWGIGYDRNVDNANESDYKYLNSQALASYVWKLAPSLYLGPMVAFDYINGRKFAKPWLLDGQAEDRKSVV